MSEGHTAPQVDLAGIQTRAEQQLRDAGSVDELEAARVEHLGRSSELTGVLRGLSSLPADERSQVGSTANRIRQQLEGLAAERRAELEAAALEAALASERVDVTLPGRPHPVGSLHLLTQTRRMIEDVLIAMGYLVVDGPEVESPWHNFTALNTPEGHPARSAVDTFYIDGDRALLRSQTSPVQVRVMQQQPPPVYVISPGRVYRRDRIDATHGSMFHQVELLAVDEGLTLADLRGTLEAFCKAIFGPERQIRLRTHFFPFTEPSVEVDVTCFLCPDPAAADPACKVCRGEGWIELLGAGMVDPNVFDALGYDANTVSGFAFGVGIERIAMLRNEVPDLRLMVENDLRFLRQFPRLPAAGWGGAS